MVCEHCELADSFPSRLRGLIGRRRLERGHGLLVRPASSIHTMFMRFPIDAVFLDRDLRVLDLRAMLRPWRAAAVRGASAVLELPAGELAKRRIDPGDRLVLAEASGDEVTGEEVAGEEVAGDEESAEPSPGFMDLSPMDRYIALALAACAAAAVLAHFGVNSRGVVSGAFAAVLVVLGALDYRHGVIPNRIVMPATAAILVAQVAFFSSDTLEWIIAGVGAAILLLIPALMRPGSIGMGDVKLALYLGVGLGFTVVYAMFIGSLSALPVAVFLLITRGIEARKETLPLGAFLAFGGVMALLITESL